ncbi:hypothetical protein D3C79_795600 [compost metagenome]
MVMVVIVIAIVMTPMVAVVAVSDPDMGIVHTEICAMYPYRATGAGGEQRAKQYHQNPLVHNNLLWFPLIMLPFPMDTGVRWWRCVMTCRWHNREHAVFPQVWGRTRI